MQDKPSVFKSDMGAFAIIPEWVLDHPDLPHGAVRLYGVLGRYADADGRCWPSRLTLGNRLGCSRDTIDRWVKDLIKMGALSVERRTNQTNIWVIRRVAATMRVGGGTDAAPVAARMRHRTIPTELYIRESSENGETIPRTDSAKKAAAIRKRLRK